METDGTPQIIAVPVVETGRPPVAHWRWWMHLIVLASFPLAAGLMGILLSDRTGALLPVSVAGLLRVTARELIFFAGIFAVAWAFSRVNRRQLLLQWRGRAMPAVWGAAYSVVLRMLIMALTTTVVAGWMLYKMMVAGNRPQELKPSFRPEVEHLVNANALAADPVYFVLMLTLVSFVLAALREELWRAGMLAGINALFPRLMNKFSGQVTAIFIVAVLFGLAHTTQGWPGVLVTTVLGAGLGAIMVWHGSIWEAVIAHGFFNAASFTFLYVMAKYSPDLLSGF